MGLSTIITPLLLAASAPIATDCPAIDGWDQVFENKNRQFIVLGEFHGTNEMPQIFGDAVCLTSKSQPITVALEMPHTDQSLIDAYLASDGGAEAKRDFLQAQIWKNDFKDGRSSEAMFMLFDRLRRLQAEGKIQSVVAFQPTQWLSNGQYEKSMAERIKRKATRNSKILILVGNVHAMRTKITFGPKPYIPMAGHLPKKSTFTLNIVDDGGSAWACTGPNKCGVITGRKPTQTNQRGVSISVKGNSPYDGVLFLGSSTTASMPQPEFSQ